MCIASLGPMFGHMMPGWQLAGFARNGGIWLCPWLAGWIAMDGAESSMG